MSDDYLIMREFIDITSLYSDQPVEPAEILHEDVVHLYPQSEPVEHPLINQLKELVSKMRAHMENDENQDVAMGVETGMNRAADMIENLLKQHGVDDIG